MGVKLIVGKVPISLVSRWWSFGVEAGPRLSTRISFLGHWMKPPPHQLESSFHHVEGLAERYHRTPGW
jgi:hypothetical protein